MDEEGHHKDGGESEYHVSKIVTKKGNDQRTGSVI